MIKHPLLHPASLLGVEFWHHYWGGDSLLGVESKLLPREVFLKPHIARPDIITDDDNDNEIITDDDNIMERSL